MKKQTERLHSECSTCLSNRFNVHTLTESLKPNTNSFLQKVCVYDRDWCTCELAFLLHPSKGVGEKIDSYRYWDFWFHDFQVDFFVQKSIFSLNVNASFYSPKQAFEKRA